MDLFQTFKSQLDQNYNRDKYKKIYAPSRKKSYNINQKKLSQILNVDKKSDKKISLNLQTKQIKISSDNKLNLNNNFESQKNIQKQLLCNDITGKNEQTNKTKQTNDKNKQIRNKIMITFQPQRPYNQKYKKLNRIKQASSKNIKPVITKSQQKPGSIRNRSPLFSNQKIQNQIHRHSSNNYYQNSMTKLSRKSISFEQQQKITPIRPKNSRKNIIVMTPQNKCNPINKTYIFNTFKQSLSNINTKYNMKQKYNINKQLDQNKLFADKSFNQLNRIYISDNIFDQRHMMNHRRSKSENKNNGYDNIYSLNNNILLKTINYQNNYKIEQKYIRNYFLQKKNKKPIKTQDLRKYQIKEKDFMKIQKIFTLKSKQAMLLNSLPKSLSLDKNHIN